MGNVARLQIHCFFALYVAREALALEPVAPNIHQMIIHKRETDQVWRIYDKVLINQRKKYHQRHNKPNKEMSENMVYLWGKT
ncbi:hypothetical protein V8B55DRAFT_1574583, partial [Mucor lusitanicus]|uniref:Secreted protein n=1 Tax=Mucor circinelloides f. lusitanicus TaxID=29924 RepID=A0A8H4F4N2_MUCCL|nr:hypothetical protein FB192DRAFT_1359631 [Mucor lusitanicus]